MVLKNIKSVYVRYAAMAIVAIFFGIFLFLLSVRFGAWGKLPGKNELATFHYYRASEVYTADSVLIGKYYLNDQQPIPYENFPEHLINALVSIEDERFYEHSGLDYQSLLRVGFKTILMQDQSSGGGSTLTQQLAKNLYPRKERNKTNLIVNKVKEMIIAKRLENLFTKEEILGHYLNTVSFGGNTYGIESASLKFFNKPTDQLNIEESATLVGMLKATHSYNPRLFPGKSTDRRNLVLQAMLNNDFLSQIEKDSISALPLKLDYREFDHDEGMAPYFREEVRKILRKWCEIENENGQNYNLYTSGLKIYTTLDSKMQQLAEETMAIHMSSLQNEFEKSHGKNAPWLKNKALIEKLVKRTESYKKLKKLGWDDAVIMDTLQQKRTMTLADWKGEKLVNASTVDSVQHYMKFLNTGSLAIDAQTGAVKTWIGGINYKYFKYDHVAQSKRQVGSTFKPIVYTAALETGISPCTYFSAQEVEYENLKGWSPSNSGDKDEAYLNYSMEMALSNSVNTVAVKVLEKTGIENVIQQAKNMGVLSELPKQPSLALGTGELYVNEMAGAYASYTNNGKAVYPYLIQTITNRKDSILAHFEPKRSNSFAFSKKTGQIMLEMMKSTIDQGTASRIRTSYKLKNDIAGKTGTTQNNKDAWFVALTPKLVHVSWVGLDNHEIGFKSTSLGQGANAALPLFALWYQKLNRDPEFNVMTKARFSKPDATVLELLDCEPIKRDGFFKRLFKNPNKKKAKRFRSGSKS
ncbi:transglycosylase domain-containing protein [Maribacter arenosus]|nr:transglycosylase domain-containing protein [Maribacter arenosus]